MRPAPNKLAPHRRRANSLLRCRTLVHRPRHSRLVNVAAAPIPDLEVEQRPVLQRARGTGRIEVAAETGRTRLRRLYQDGCAKILLPVDRAARSLEAVAINTSGGLTGGDQMAWRATARAGASLTLTTQACEKVYRARDGHAAVSVGLDVGPGARIDWLPQETILFDGADLSRTLEADLAAGATLLVVEAVRLCGGAPFETAGASAARESSSSPMTCGSKGLSPVSRRSPRHRFARWRPRAPHLANMTS